MVTASHIDRRAQARVESAVALIAMEHGCRQVSLSIASPSNFAALAANDPRVQIFVEMARFEATRDVGTPVLDPAGNCWFVRALSAAGSIKEQGDPRSVADIVSDTGAAVRVFLNSRAGNIERLTDVLLREETLDTRGIQSVIGGN